MSIAPISLQNKVYLPLAVRAQNGMGSSQIAAFYQTCKRALLSNRASRG